jgi:carbamoyl-phosphate synthase large subunit
MPDSVTIMISSAGRRVGLIECFRQSASELGIQLTVVAVDVEPSLSAACALSDRAFKVPRCTDPMFLDRIMSICRAESVQLIVPTIDTELVPYAAARANFADAGIRVSIADQEVVEVARDKLRTAEWLAAAGLPTPRTTAVAEVLANPGDWTWPVIAKPRGGSASAGVGIVASPGDLESRSRTDPSLIVQELCRGPEYTVNLFFDAAGTLRSIVPHRRLEVRGGEVSKGRTVRHERLLSLGLTLARAISPRARGALCFQAIEECAELHPRIIELNARFGGGYPLAHAAGATFTRWLLLELLGKAPDVSEPTAWRDGVTMLRYDVAVFRDAEDSHGEAARSL